MIEAASVHSLSGAGYDIVKACDYLRRYNSFNRLTLVGGMFTLLENFYNQKKYVKSMENALWGIKHMVNLELDAPVFSGNGTVLHHTGIS